MGKWAWARSFPARCGNAWHQTNGTHPDDVSAPWEASRLAASGPPLAPPRALAPHDTTAPLEALRWGRPLPPPLPMRLCPGHSFWRTVPRLRPSRLLVYSRWLVLGRSPLGAPLPVTLALVVPQRGLPPPEVSQ